MEKVLLEFETHVYGFRIKLPKEFYTLTNERLKMKRKGVLSRDVTDVELYRIRNTKVHQGMVDRMAGVGTIEIIDADGNKTKLERIKDPHEVRERIRTAVKAAKEAEGVAYRQDL